MKELLNQIMQRLALVAALKYIDEDWGQLEYGSKPVQWPCALINYGDAEWSNLSMKKQMGLATITVTIAAQKFGNTSLNAPAQQKESAFSILDIINEVHLVIHGWKPEAANSSMYRKSSQRVVRDDGIQEHVIRYQVQIKDEFVQTYNEAESTLPVIIEQIQDEETT